MHIIGLPLVLPQVFYRFKKALLQFSFPLTFPLVFNLYLSPKSLRYIYKLYRYELFLVVYSFIFYLFIINFKKVSGRFMDDRSTDNY